MSDTNRRTNENTGRYAYDGLDKVIHEKSRLSIVTSLATHPNGLLFNDLKDLCCLTDGNLSRHLLYLANNQVVEIIKSFHNNRPQTLVKLTAEGRQRFLDHIEALESVITDALTATRRGEIPPGRSLSEGWSPV